MNYREKRTLDEMLIGRLNVRAAEGETDKWLSDYAMYGLKYVQHQKQWEFLIGLCVCELAERIEL
jgi:hypothetical protein